MKEDNTHKSGKHNLIHHARPPCGTRVRETKSISWCKTLTAKLKQRRNCNLSVGNGRATSQRISRIVQTQVDERVGNVHHYKCKTLGMQGKEAERQQQRGGQIQGVGEDYAARFKQQSSQQNVCSQPNGHLMRLQLDQSKRTGNHEAILGFLRLLHTPQSEQEKQSTGTHQMQHTKKLNKNKLASQSSTQNAFATLADHSASEPSPGPLT
jgi:hypothetical protein